MATIPNFPQRFLEEHATWHNNMGMGRRSGDGIEFLEFHRNFIKKALEWYDARGMNPTLVQPWSAIPSEMKRHPRWNNRLQEVENRMTRNLSSFNSGDELGRYLLTTRLHDAVHVLGSEVYDDEDFGLISLAPQSTLFYNWHGLIDNWWKQLEEL
jgi:hypothetical protein